jgi:hypothetical protein
MPGGCTTCTGMSGSGAGTGSAPIRAARRPIRWVRIPGRAVCVAAAASAAPPNPAAPRSVTLSPLERSTPSLVFVLRGLPTDARNAATCNALGLPPVEMEQHAEQSEGDQRQRVRRVARDDLSSSTTKPSASRSRPPTRPRRIATGARSSTMAARKAPAAGARTGETVVADRADRLDRGDH